MTGSPAREPSELGERLERVRAEVADAIRRAGRRPEEVTTIVVTKFHPASLVRELAALGVRDFGENRHQEAAAKAAELADLDIDWHFVGQLQSNKAKAVRAYASVIHSVDRPSLVHALASDGADIDCFVQVDLSDEPGRGGVDEAGLEPLAQLVLETPGLRLLGVMAVAPLGEDPRRAFARLRRLSDRVRTIAPEARSISAGMSADFEAALQEGATHLRLGTAITGKRPAPG